MDLSALIDIGPGGRRVLEACHCPPTGTGAQLIVAQVLRAFERAIEAGAPAEIVLWRDVISSLDAELTRIRQVDPQAGDLLTRIPGTAESIFAHRLCELPVRRNTAPLLARAVAVALERSSTVAQAIVSGIFTLERLREGKGGASPAWNGLLTIEFDAPSVRGQLKTLERGSRCFEFALAAAEVVEAGLSGPRKVADRPSLETEVEDGPVPVDAVRERRNLYPTVSARLKEASYAPFTQKLGIHHRDYPGIEHMAPVCQALAEALKSDQAIDRAIGILGSVVVVSGYEPEHAMALPINTRASVWIDSARGVVVYNFLEVISKHFDGQNAAPRYLPVFSPLPQSAARAIGRQFSLNPASSVEALLEPLYSSAGYDFFQFLDAFRTFIRARGNQVWRMYGGRLANGYQRCILEISGSDMAAAALAMGFAANAPASMHYYAAEYSWLWGIAGAVFTAIGFDAPQPLIPTADRFGSARVLSSEESRRGWEGLIAEIELTRAKVHNAQQPHESISAAAEWLRLLCAAFIIRTGHRATRIAELTPAVVLTHPEFGVIFDKAETTDQDTESLRGGSDAPPTKEADGVSDLDRRVQPRLIPFDSVTHAILRAAVECREFLLRRGLPFEPGEPLFVDWCGYVGVPAQAISTRSVGAVTARHFNGSAANFGREMWVTYLDQCGAKNWLVRALTGHSRDLTRVSDTYFCVPPLKVVDELRRAMGFVGERIFGSSAPTGIPTSWTPSCFPLDLGAPQAPRNSHRMPNLWTVLEPTNALALQGWLLTQRIRTALMSPPEHLSAHSAALLFLTFIELMPDAESSIAAVVDTAKCTWMIGGCRFVRWNRGHFAHPTAFPLHGCTSLLLELASHQPVSRARLLRETISYLQTTDPTFAWPDTDEDAWRVAANAAAGFRRLELPPSMVALSSAVVPAPCPSLISLERLAGAVVTPTTRPQRPPRMNGSTGERRPDVKRLKEILEKYQDTSVRQGERRKRAILARKEIVDCELTWSPFGRFLADWLLEELHRTRDDTKGRYQISSLATYLTSLTAAKAVDDLGDPYAWEAEDWTAFLRMADDQTLSPKEHADRKKLKYQHNRALNERLQPSATALLRSLSRRSISVDSSVWALVRERQEDSEVRDSASSVLILSRDLQVARELASQALRSTPDEVLEAKLIELRVEFSQAVPLRAGDLGSLDWNWRAGNALLNIRRRGYSVHKSDAAIRIAPIPPDSVSKINRLQEELRECLGKQPELLLRLNGTSDDGARDAELHVLWGESLKAATGDARARPHSVRARTTCNLSWPGWEEVVTRLLQGNITPEELRSWTRNLMADWLRVAKAAAAAGHADLRSVLGSYLSVWALVHTAMAHGLLREITPKAALLHKLQIIPESMGRAASRANSTGSSFSPWAWIESQARKRLTKFTLESASNEGFCQVPVSNAQASRTYSPSLEEELVALLYLQLRIQGITQQRAMTIARLPLAAASPLERLIPEAGLELDPTARQQSEAKPRGKAGDMHTTCSVEGTLIRKWIRALPESGLVFLHRALTRDKSVPPRIYDGLDSWRTVVNPMPDQFRLRVRRGPRHQFEKGFKPEKVEVVVDDRIGAVPDVTIVETGRENRVRQARLRAVLATAVLARMLMEQRK